MVTSEEPDRPADGWKYAYVAGAVDFGSSLSVKVSKSNRRKIGYGIAPQMLISSTDKTVLGFIDEFCEAHDIVPRFRETKTSKRLEFSKRDDLLKFLKLVRPYLISRHAEVEILINDLIPGLETGKGSSKEGFYELIGYVDQIREETQASTDVRYDQDYFREEWDL